MPRSAINALNALNVVRYKRFELDGDHPRDVDRPTITPWMILYLWAKSTYQISASNRVLNCCKSRMVGKVGSGW